MANNKIPLEINLYQNLNMESNAYCKWYGRVVRRSTLNTRGLCEHIQSHGSIYTSDVVAGVIAALRRCIPELIAQGVAVQLEGIGTFYPTAKNVKEGAATIADAKDMGADQLIEGIHVRFTPEGTELDDITSKAMKKRSALQLRNVVEITKTTVAGKVKRSHTYTPIEEASDPVTP